MNVVYSGNEHTPEFEISGTATELVKLGFVLLDVTDVHFVKGSDYTCDVYPVTLDGLLFEIINDDAEVVDVKLENSMLCFAGSKIAIKKLGQGLINIFSENPSDGRHIHYDYVGEGVSLLRKTNFSIIVICREEKAKTHKLN